MGFVAAEDEVRCEFSKNERFWHSNSLGALGHPLTDVYLPDYLRR